MKKYLVLLVAGIALLLASVASASLEPGVYDPDNTGLCQAVWIDATQTLHLEKNGPSDTNCAPGGDIHQGNLVGEPFESASFTLANAEQCNGGSPRFDLVLDNGIWFAGCNNVEPTINEDGSATYTFGPDDLTPQFQTEESPGNFVGFDDSDLVADVLIDIGPATADMSDITLNGIVQAPEAAAPAPTPAPTVIPEVSQTFLCYSKLPGSTPGIVDFANVATRLVQGWFTPYALKGTVTGGQNVNGYHLVCNVDGLKGSGTGLNGSGPGPLLDALAWKDVLITYGVAHINHYEVYS